MKAVVGKVTSCASRASKPAARKPAAWGDAFSQSLPGMVAAKLDRLASARAGNPSSKDRVTARRWVVIVEPPYRHSLPHRPRLRHARLAITQLGIDGVAQ